jgi:hypothetical protein
MLRTLRRIINDIGNRKNIEAYATSFAVLLFAIGSFFFDIVPQNVQFAALLAGIALLVFKTTDPTPSTAASLDDVLEDRTGYGKFSDFIRGAKSLSIYGASNMNVLREMDDIEREVLDRGGTVRVLIQDSLQESSVNILVRQLDKTYDLRRDLEMAQLILERMQERRPTPNLQHRFVPYSPGFSLTIVNAGQSDGRLIVEFYGYENKAIKERMHIEIHHRQSSRWFDYWAKQFELMWESARIPETKAIDG